MAGLPGALPPMGNFDPAGFTEGKSVASSRCSCGRGHARPRVHARLARLPRAGGGTLFRLGDKDIGPAIRHLDEVRAEVPIFFEILVLGIGFARSRARSRAGRRRRAPTRRTARSPTSPTTRPSAASCEDKSLPGRHRFRPGRPQALVTPSRPRGEVLPRRHGTRPRRPQALGPMIAVHAGPCLFRFDTVAAMASAWPSSGLRVSRSAFVFRPQEMATKGSRSGMDA